MVLGIWASPKCIIEYKSVEFPTNHQRALQEELERARVDASGGVAGFYDSERRMVA